MISGMIAGRIERGEEGGFTDDSTHLKGEAGEREAQTESEEWRDEDGKEHVAASPGKPEAVAAEPPGAFRTADTFRLADHVVPHHLRFTIGA